MIVAITVNAKRAQMAFMLTDAEGEREIMARLDRALDREVGRTWDGDELRTLLYWVKDREDGLRKIETCALFLGLLPINVRDDN